MLKWKDSLSPKKWVQNWHCPCLRICTESFYVLGQEDISRELSLERLQRTPFGDKSTIILNLIGSCGIGNPRIEENFEECFFFSKVNTLNIGRWPIQRTQLPERQPLGSPARLVGNNQFALEHSHYNQMDHSGKVQHSSSARKGHPS